MQSKRWLLSRGHRATQDPLVEVTLNRDWPPLWSSAEWLRIDWWRKSPLTISPVAWRAPAVDSLCEELVRLPRSATDGVAADQGSRLSELFADLGRARVRSQLSASECILDLDALWAVFCGEPPPLTAVHAVLRGWKEGLR